MCEKIESDVVRSRESEEKFLIHAYDQMFTTINRIHNNIWEMVVAVGGGIGVLKIYSEYKYSGIFDFAILGYIITLSWILTRLVDFNYWCNRNLYIIHKIENYFLRLSTNNIYENFRSATPPSTNKIKTTILIQIAFVITIQIGTLFFYFFYKSNISCAHAFLETLSVFILLWGISFYPAYRIFKLRNEIYKNKINKK